MKPKIHREALKEIKAATRYYEKQRPELGDRFLQDYVATRDFILEFPEAGKLIQSPTIRQFSFKHFKHTLIYNFELDSLQILSVGHQSRKPEHWLKRLDH